MKNQTTTRIYSYADKPGSVSYVLKQHKKELKKIKDFETLKNKMIEYIAAECPRKGTTTDNYLSYLYNKSTSREQLLHWMNRIIEGGSKYKTANPTYSVATY